MRALALAAAAALCAAPAAAQRPPEEELFGGPAREPARPGEAELFGAQGAPNAVPPPPEGIISRERDDTLRVGGQLYLRAATSALEQEEPGNWTLSSPNLLDVYLDARPNDRVRAFVLGRMLYDPTISPADPAGLSSATASSPRALFDAATAGRSGANPRGVLDQLWINFDVGRRAYVTAGRQHAKWGVGRFWNPTDYLHPVRRAPLAVFDERVGTTMVKVHVPWEARGWNLYGVAVLEDLAGDLPRRNDGSQDGTNRLGRVGVGGRAELVLGGVELGLDALAQAGHRPRFGVDVSSGLWDLDVYAEAALRTTVDTPRWRERAGTSSADPVWERFERADRTSFTPQVTTGATYAVMYSDEDAVTFGAEYFYDRSGYENPRMYPWLLFVTAASGIEGTPAQVRGQPSPYTPFYLGRHYAGAYASLPSPGRWNDTTFTLSVLGNLSDKSFVARLDHSVLALTYLRVETYAASRFGAAEGEFRRGVNLPALNVGTAAAPVTTDPFRSPPQVFEAGLALRVSL